MPLPANETEKKPSIYFSSSAYSFFLRLSCPCNSTKTIFRVFAHKFNLICAVVLLKIRFTLTWEKLVISKVRDYRANLSKCIALGDGMERKISHSSCANGNSLAYIFNMKTFSFFSFGAWYLRQFIIHTMGSFLKHALQSDGFVLLLRISSE